MAGKVIYPLEEPLTTGMKYAVIGNKEKFLKKKHAWKVWRALRSFRCVVYPVAPDVERLEGYKVYKNITLLKDKIDVAVVCLSPGAYPDLLKEGKEAGIKYIWFQEQTWSEELENECKEAEIGIVKGCVLKHRVFAKPIAFFHPCYWHGKGHPKVVEGFKLYSQINKSLL